MSEEAWRDRRAFPRAYRHSHMSVWMAAGGEPIGATVMNISSGGVRFLSPSPIDVGSRIQTGVEGARHEAEVLECSPRFEGYAIRARYTDVAT